MTTDGRPSLFHYGNPGETHTAQVRRGPRISGAMSHVSTTIDPTYLEKGSSHWSFQVRTSALSLQGSEGLCSFAIPVTTRHHSLQFQERDASHTRLSHSPLTLREEPPRGSSVPIGSSVGNLHPLFTSRNKAPTAKPYRTHQSCHKPLLSAMTVPSGQ
jgi:hypothetical protein